MSNIKNELGLKIKSRKFVVNGDVVACVAVDGLDEKIHTIAKCLPTDEFDEGLGKNITGVKAEIKIINRRLKPLRRVVKEYSNVVSELEMLLVEKQKVLDTVYTRIKAKTGV